MNSARTPWTPGPTQLLLIKLLLIALCLLSLTWGIYSEVKYMRNHSRKAAAAN